MRKDFRFAGTGGQGVISLAMIMATAYGIFENKEVTQTQSYGAEARGGACQAALIVSDEKIGYMKVDDADIFVAFSIAGYNKYVGALKPGATVFVDSTFIPKEETDKLSDCTVYSLPATEIAERDFQPFAANIVMLGFMASKLEDLSLESCESVIRHEIAPKHIPMNLAAVKAGYERGMA